MTATLNRRAALSAFTAAAGIAVIPASATVTLRASPKASAWDTALADYRTKLAFSEAMPLGTPNEDDALDAYCEAMDHLIDDVPSPTAEALAIKLELAFERYQWGSFPEEIAAVLIADARQLAKREV